MKFVHTILRATLGAALVSGSMANAAVESDNYERLQKYADEKLFQLESDQFEGAEGFDLLMQELAKDPIDYERVKTNLDTFSAAVVENSATIKGLDLLAESNLTGWGHRKAAEWGIPFAYLPAYLALGMKATFNKEATTAFPVSGLNLGITLNSRPHFRGLTRLRLFVDSLTFQAGADLEPMVVLKNAVEYRAVKDACAKGEIEALPSDFVDLKEVVDAACDIVAKIGSAKDFHSFLIASEEQFEVIERTIDQTIAKTTQQTDTWLDTVIGFITDLAVDNRIGVETCQDWYDYWCTPHLAINLGGDAIWADADLRVIIRGDGVDFEISGDAASNAVDSWAGEEMRSWGIRYAYVGFKVIEQANEGELQALGKALAKTLEEVKEDLEADLVRDLGTPVGLLP